VRSTIRQISNDEVSRAVSLDDAALILRYAYLGLHNGATRNHPRTRTAVGAARLSTLGGVLPDCGYLGSKTYASCGSETGFAIALFSSETARPLAFLEGEGVTRLKGSITTALVAERWAREDAAVLSVFGTGVQARAHVEALRRVRPIRQVNVVSRGDAGDYVRWVETHVGIGARQVAADEAAANGDIIVAATRAASPLFDGNLVRPGTFVAAVGTSTLDRRELDQTLIDRADRIGVELKISAQAEAGDLTGLGDWNTVAELPDILRDQLATRDTDREIRVFKSTGLGIADIAVAVAAYARLSGEWETLRARLADKPQNPTPHAREPRRLS
jgi:ornithine cyclodeaminase